MQLRNYSSETIKGYVRFLAQFARYFQRSHLVLTPEHARQYQLHLLEKTSLAHRGGFRPARSHSDTSPNASRAFRPKGRSTRSGRA